MIIKIVCAGDDSFSKLYHRDNNEYIIGCDGGSEVLEKMGIVPNFILGDFDSYQINKSLFDNVEIQKFKSEKDESDLELAILYALKLDYDRIEVYNCTGKRQDHFYAAITLLKKLNNSKISIIDEYNQIYISNGCEFKKDNYKYVSFFSLNDKTILSLKGFKYELNNYNLKIDDSLCLSNEIEEVGILKTNHHVLVIRSK